MLQKLIVVAAAILAALTAYAGVGAADNNKQQSEAQQISIAELPDFDCCG